MRRYAVVSFALASVLAFGACGSSSGETAGSSPKTTSPDLFSSKTYETAKPTPSKSAKMVCEKEVSDEIKSSLGIPATRITVPTWNKAQHIYSCAYVYPNGRIVLSVKEMSSASETTAYFNSIVRKYGTIQALIGLGQGAWVLKNSDVVVRKDYKVLLVNVAGIPQQFLPLMKKSDAAINVAVTIMGCWTGE